MSEEKTPLAKADPKSLDDLYSSDPLDLTDDDVDRITADLREKRALWAREDAEAKTQGRKRSTKAWKEPPEKGQLSLADLGLVTESKGNGGADS